MLILLSPAKSLDFESPLATRKHTEPRLLDESERLIEVMRDKPASELAGLMHDLGKIYSRCATKTPQYRPGPHECFNFALLTEPLQQLAQQDWQAHQLLCSMLAPYQHHRSEQYAVETLFRHADQASCASNRMHGLFAGKPAHYHFVRSGTQMVRRVV